MGGYGNPLVGSGWDTSNQSQSPMGPITPIGTDPSSPPNPGGYGNPKGAREIQRNMGILNMQAAEMKRQLAQQFAPLMGRYGQEAGNFFQNLMNFGSPFYRQKQQEAFTQGVNQNQNASAQAQQQLRSQGFGSTPSGANAAMIGGMQQQGSQNLSEQYLQNLFQNEQMQGAGAQGLESTANLFNPVSALGGTSMGTDVSIPSSFFQNFQNIGQGIGSMLGGGGNLAQGMK